MRVAKLNREIELFVGGLGAFHALYLSIHAFLERKRNRNNLVLGLLLLALSLRIVKSLLWLGLDHVPDWILNLGFVAHSAIGPLLLLYLQGFILKQKRGQWNFLHFLPALFLLVFVGDLRLDHFWYKGGYTALLAHQMVYSVISITLLFVELRGKKSGSKPINDKERIWITIIIVAVAAINTTYFSNYVLGLTPYVLGPLLFPVFIYFLSYFALRNPQLFKKQVGTQKYANIRLSDNEVKIYAERLEVLIEEQKIYLQSDCSLGGLADALRMQPYLLSYVINNSYGQNYSDLINTLRIKEAKKRLEDTTNGDFKVSSIAFDCGFNTISAFNAWFKKVEGKTPSQYRKLQAKP